MGSGTTVRDPPPEALSRLVYQTHKLEHNLRQASLLGNYLVLYIKPQVSSPYPRYFKQLRFYLVLYIKPAPGKFPFALPAPDPVSLDIFGVGGPESPQIARVLIEPGPGIFIVTAEIIGVLRCPVLLGESLPPPLAFFSGAGFLPFSHSGIWEENPSAERALFLGGLIELFYLSVHRQKRSYHNVKV